MAGAPGGMEYFTPNCSMRWGNCEFSLNPPSGGDWDFWIVFGNALAKESARVAPGNTLFIAGEPPQKKVYPRGFYRQFAHIIDTHRGSRHPGLIIDAMGLCWMVGLSWKELSYKFGYDHLKQLPYPEKINQISVVCSSTTQTQGQKLRLRFLDAVKERMGDQIVHYGKGFKPVEDKMDVIAPYRFNIVLENSQSPHYWTEKLTDAYLGWAFPLYLGCPNIGDYFDPASLCALDINNVDASVRRMRSLLDVSSTPREKEVIRAAREKVLDQYNPFARFSHWVEELYSPGPRQEVIIRSEKAFRLMTGLSYRLKKHPRA
jgi:hypothetical protein